MEGIPLRVAGVIPASGILLKRDPAFPWSTADSPSPSLRCPGPDRNTSDLGDRRSRQPKAARGRPLQSQPDRLANELPLLIAEIQQG